MSGSGNLTGSHLAPSRNVRMMGAIAEAIQRVFLGGTGSSTDEIGSVSIRVEGDQIESVAPGTLNAMANPSRHCHCECKSTATEGSDSQESDEAEEIGCETTAHGDRVRVWDRTEPRIRSVRSDARCGNIEKCDSDGKRYAKMEERIAVSLSFLRFINLIIHGFPPAKTAQGGVASVV